MSSKTKIVVLKSRELIYTGIFVILGIMLILLLFYMFSPGDEDKKHESSSVSTSTSMEEDISIDIDTSSTTEAPVPATDGEEISETMSSYIPGVYTSQLNLGGSPLQLSVTVDENHVTGVSVDNLDETITAMYPLISPSIDEINSQIGLVSSIDDITYSSDNKYTTIIILEAIEDALEDARK